MAPPELQKLIGLASANADKSFETVVQERIEQKANQSDLKKLSDALGGKTDQAFVETFLLDLSKKVDREGVLKLKDVIVGIETEYHCAQLMRTHKRHFS